jgi:hypothetical protein
MSAFGGKSDIEQAASKMLDLVNRNSREAARLRGLKMFEVPWTY